MLPFNFTQSPLFPTGLAVGAQHLAGWSSLLRDGLNVSRTSKRDAPARMGVTAMGQIAYP